MKDDKTYPYIQITKEPYPQVLLTRKIKKDGSKYFGPYTDSKRLRTILKVMHKVFPIRSCSYFIDDKIVVNVGLIFAPQSSKRSYIKELEAIL